MARVSGIVVPDEQDRLILAPKVCPVCQLPNVSTNKHCGRCGTPLTIEAADTLRIKREWFDQQPEILEVKEQIKALEESLKKIKGQKEIPSNQN
jgi:predicted amidophosphoribosyltransferase